MTSKEYRRLLPRTVQTVETYPGKTFANDYYNKPNDQGFSSFSGYPATYNEAFEHLSENITDPDQKLRQGMRNLLLHYLNNDHIPTTQNRFFLSPFRCSFRTNRDAVERLVDSIDWEQTDPNEILRQLKCIFPANENGGLQNRIHFLQLKLRDWAAQPSQTRLEGASSTALSQNSR